MTIISKDNLQESLERFHFLLLKSWEVENKMLFFHTISKLFLLMKCDIINSHKDLRGISIMPAIIMIADKLILPIIKGKITPTLAVHQYAGKDESDINIA